MTNLLQTNKIDMRKGLEEEKKMIEYIGKDMVCDSRKADGSIHFEKDYFEFRPRNLCDKKFEFRVNYKDIKEVRGYKGIKSRVEVETNETTYYLYIYKMNTLVEILNTAKNAVIENQEAVDIDLTKKEKEPLTEEQLDKLTKLNQLHKDGVLSDAQFEEEKNLILNR